jgi:hypothetical protein
MQAEHYVWMFVDRDTDQGFLCCDCSTRGILPWQRLWDERRSSDSRIARVLRSMQQPPALFAVRDSSDNQGLRPLPREVAHLLFFRALFSLGDKAGGGRVVLSDPATRALLELPGMQWETTGE